MSGMSIIDQVNVRGIWMGINRKMQKGTGSPTTLTFHGYQKLITTLSYLWPQVVACSTQCSVNLLCD